MKAQLCPKCNGQGIVSKPAWVPGDVNEWTSSLAVYPCDVCGGNKIIYVPDDDPISRDWATEEEDMAWKDL